MNKPTKSFYLFDSFKVDVSERQLWQDEKLVSLTPKVFDMLLILLENKGRTVEKEELLKQVWADTFVEEGSLNRNISTLRKALGDNSSEQKFIKTLPKRGYRFTANVEKIFTEEETNETVDSPLKEDNQSFSPSKFPFQISATKVFLAVLAVLISTIILFLGFRQPETEVDLSGLTENERQLLKDNNSTNTQSVEYYVKGRSLWHQRSAEGLYQSIIYLERAVKNDPEFALARAALADAYAFDAGKWKLAKNEAEEVIRLNPSLGESYATIGFVQMFWEWKVKESARSFQKAVEISPNYPTAHQWYAINLIFNGQGAAALVEMKRALELAPDSIAINADLCQTYYYLQKYDDALAQCRKTLEMDESFLNAHNYLSDIYAAKGMYDKAVEEFFTIEKLKSDFALPAHHLENLRKSYESGGIQGFWKTHVAYFEETKGEYAPAKYYMRLGKKDKALIALKKICESRQFNFISLISDPVFLDLAKEPEFAELVKKFD